VTERRIRELRAYVTRGGADYHDRGGDHWIDGHIATPMARYPEYRGDRRRFGIDVLGTLVVEVEADDGTVGFAVTTGGEPAAWVVERHLARFVEGAPATAIEQIWDQMYKATVFYGRRGLVVNAISGVDLALYDLLGRLRGEPVYQLLGGAVRDELPCYATGPRPDVARRLGFLGAKLPLAYSPSEGPDGFAANLAALAAAREAVGDGFPLMLDCWMALDVEYATRLAAAASDHGLHWLEEPLLPDDYWGCAEVRRALPRGVQLATGEHEATSWGFRMLLELGCADVLQPDVGWCGGLTELRRIAALADTHGVDVIPHGSSVYSYQFVVTRPRTPWAEFLMMHPQGTEVVPMFSPVLVDEPVPVGGHLRVPDRAGFGVRLNPECVLTRPYERQAVHR
jgi:L-rhamnonate dehydratase